MIQNFPAFYYTMLLEKNEFRNTIIIFFSQDIVPSDLDKPAKEALFAPW